MTSDLSASLSQLPFPVPIIKRVVTPIPEVRDPAREVSRKSCLLGHSRLSLVQSLPLAPQQFPLWAFPALMMTPVYLYTLPYTLLLFLPLSPFCSGPLLLLLFSALPSSLNSPMGPWNQEAELTWPPFLVCSDTKPLLEFRISGPNYSCRLWAP